MIARVAIVDEARRWVGTPYQHQQHSRGIATDCAGLVAGVAVALGVVPPDWWDTTFTQYAGYGRQPSSGMLERICGDLMTEVPIDRAEPGDVLAFRFRRETMHLGFLVPYAHGGLSILHALSSAGQVVEHSLDNRWRSRITHAWQMPGVA